MSENTNAGERVRLTLDLSNKLNEEVERLAAANGVTKDDVLRFARELLAKKADAALSAQSTGSAGVAAEPVAWAYEELKTYTFDTWEHALSYEKPELAPHHRKIEPLFKHPPVATNPAAWLWEYIDKVGVWHEISSVEKPNPEGRRDIRPLYEHPPVAAEPVALREAASMAAMYLRTGFINCERCGHEQPTKETDALYTLDEALAAAPTPPAGGGETEGGSASNGKTYPDVPAVDHLNYLRAFADSFAPNTEVRQDAEHALQAICNALATLSVEPSPASPAGDLISLSAGATPGLLRIWPQSGNYISGPSEHVAEISNIYLVSDRPIAAPKGDAAFILALWNAYRSGRLVEAAPAAPRKGPSEEEIARVAYDVLCGGDPAPRLEPAAWQIARGVLALLAPADRGETQAEGDGWQLVPIKPTPAMIAATWSEPVVRIESHNARNKRIYAAMLAAAPSPDQNRGEPDQGGAITEAGR